MLQAYYGSENFDIGYGRDAFRRLGCPVWQCETSDNRTDVHNYDAILFHYRSWKLNDLLKYRSPHQRYVFWTWESPMWRIYGDDPSLMGNFFNWTMTYRWDSDMVQSENQLRNGEDENGRLDGVELWITQQQERDGRDPSKIYSNRCLWRLWYDDVPKEK